MRAREPDIDGVVVRDGVAIGYEVFGSGTTAVVFPPVDAIVDSRAWKAQVPYLAQRHRVITIDSRGNGRSDRPQDPLAYTDTEMVADTIAVMDEVGVDRAVLVGLCSSAWRALLTAVLHPERVLGVVSIATYAPYLTEPLPQRAEVDFETPRESCVGWQKENRHYWREHWQDYAEFFFDQLLSEPHSTKQYEDCVAWAMQTDGVTMAHHDDGPLSVGDRSEVEELLRGITCPVLTIHGQDDACQPPSRSHKVAELTGGQHLTLEGAGHLPMAREPVAVNLAIRDFLRQLVPPGPATRRWTRPVDRPHRLLYLSSPIGLGHSRRDLAIADELARLCPDLQIDWLAQPPLTALLERRGDRIHPASAHLASEVAHIDSECAEHDLHAFQAIRRMDEILVNNFMVFAEAVEETPYDAWVGDEAWELDYFLHENPELKRAPYVWLTDFVGWLPMPDGGEREAFLTTDYNAEMVEQVARFPALRDRSLFVGNAEDIVADSLGPGLPSIRDWTEDNFDFVGYVMGHDPREVADREEVRARLGWGSDETVCVVSVGGSGAGRDLLLRAIAAHPYTAAAVPGLRTVVVAGPRIDPRSLPAAPGVEVHGFVPDLYRQLAAADIALVQGGLTTTMELAAHRTPFVYVPLRHHFEQNFHVRHRLERYRAGSYLSYEDAEPEQLAQVLVEELRRHPGRSLPVETDGARRAAERIAELL